MKMNPLLHWGNYRIIRGFHFLDPLGGLGQRLKTSLRFVCLHNVLIEGFCRVGVFATLHCIFSPAPLHKYSRSCFQRYCTHAVHK